MPQAATEATWLWRPVTDPATMIMFLRAWGVRELFVGVPWTGPDPTQDRRSGDRPPSGRLRGELSRWRSRLG